MSDSISIRHSKYQLLRLCFRYRAKRTAIDMFASGLPLPLLLYIFSLFFDGSLPTSRKNVGLIVVFVVGALGRLLPVTRTKKLILNSGEAFIKWPQHAERIDVSEIKTICVSSTSEVSAIKISFQTGPDCIFLGELDAQRVLEWASSHNVQVQNTSIEEFVHGMKIPTIFEFVASPYL